MSSRAATETEPKRHRAAVPPDVEVAIRHYVELLERHIMEDTPIAVLARKIYRRHARALDLILEHRPDAQEVMLHEIVRCVEALQLSYEKSIAVRARPPAMRQLLRKRRSSCCRAAASAWWRLWRPSKRWTRSARACRAASASASCSCTAA